MLAGRMVAGAALDTVDEVFLLVVAFAGFTGLETAFFSFCVMSFNLAVKMKKGLRQDTPAENLVVGTDTIVAVTEFIIL